MNDDTAEAALGLLGLGRLPHYSPSPPLPPPTLTYSDEYDCICGFSYEEGLSIACDECSRWCHAICVGIFEGEVPDEWRCWVCRPRPMDRERAVNVQKEIQYRKAQEIEVERSRRRATSPGLERKPRRASALAIEGGGAGTKRKRRPSITAPHQPPSEDEHVDIDNSWTTQFVPMSRDHVPDTEARNKLRRHAQDWRGVTALHSHPTQIATPVRLSTNALSGPSRTTVNPIPNHDNSSVRPVTYGVHTTHSIPSDHLVAPYSSTIVPSATYLSDPLNAYAHLGMPKPFVHLLGPPLDLTLDARLSGNESRFVRSGCRPNAVLRPIVCQAEEESLVFGIFALRDLKANEEVVLGWEWDDGNAVHRLPALLKTPNAFPQEETAHYKRQMRNILHALGSTFTTCACGAQAKHCALNQMTAFVESEREASAEVDLGPLVGSLRGFETRERVRGSGGMAGVEMVESDGEVDVVSGTPVGFQVIELPPSDGEEYEWNQPRKRLRKELYAKMDTPASSNPSSRPRSRAEDKRHLQQRPREEEDPPDVIPETTEDKMPPKMRKRWIHESFEALKAENEEEDVEILDEVVEGQADEDVEVDVDGDETEDEVDKGVNRVTSMDVDGDSPPRRNRLPPSPATSFSQLSLTSPMVSPLKVARASSPSYFSSLRKSQRDISALIEQPPSPQDVQMVDSPTLSSQPPSPLLPPIEFTMAPPEVALEDSPASPSPEQSPLRVESELPPTPNRSIPSPSPPHAERLPSPPSASPPAPPDLRESPSPREMSPEPPVEISETPSARTRSPAPPPLIDSPPKETSPAQPAKVKLSLKDFALRKKQLREQAEAAKSLTASPKGADVPLAGEAPQPPVHVAHDVFSPPPAMDDLEVKIELVQEARPEMLVDTELEPPPISPIVSPPHTASPSDDSLPHTPPPPAAELAIRQSSHEEGEIPTTQPKPKPIQSLSTLRSHTPPTQPRSFTHSSASPALHATSSSAPPNFPQRRSSLPPSSLVHRSPVPPSMPGSLALQGIYPGGCSTANVLGRAPPSGPRALRAGLANGNTAPISSSGLRLQANGHYIPKGPSADRVDWDRERGWPPRPRGRGNGPGTGWNR